MQSRMIRTRGSSRLERYIFTSVAVVCIGLVITISAAAQVTTADVLGTVTDNTGAVLANAKVTITNTATNESRTAPSNSVGDYVFTLLLPGKYSVRVEATGFKAFVSPVTIVAGDRARIDARLQIGSTGETVEVQATVPLLQTDTSTITSTITDQPVEELPLPTRNLTNLVELVPGANEASSVNGLSSGQRPDDRRQSSSFTVHGHDELLNNELIDGTDNNERVIGTIGVKPSIDAIQEVSVETNDYAAETGRSPGAVVNIVTKSGTNNFHGSVYEFFQNNALNARNPFDPVPNANTPISPQSELRQNDFGASFGGPIIKDKTFFFGAVEEFRQVAGVQNPIFDNIPTLAQEQAGPAALVASDPLIPAGTPVDPIAAKLFTLYPAPNTGAPGATANNFLFDPNREQFSTTVDGRIDHHFNENNSLYARYTLNNVSTDIPNNLPSVNINGTFVSPGSGPFGFSGPARDVAHNGQLNYTHIFTPSLVLELKAAYTRINNFSNTPNAGTNASTLFGFPSNINFGPASSGLVLIEPSGLQNLGDSEFVPLQDLNNTFQYNGAVSYIYRTHTFKAGAELIRRQTREVQSANANGDFTFGIPGDSNVLATFLTGAFTAVSRTTDLFAPDYRMWEPGFYVQDNWKVKHWLTLNYGFRYDVYTPFTEVHNHLSNFDVATGQVLVAGQGGVSNTAGVSTDYSNFAPRVGFAASLGHGMVVRGGFALTYFPGNYTSNASLKNPPFVDSFNPNCASPLAVAIENNAVAAGNISPSQVQTSCATVAGAPTSLESGIPSPVQVSTTTPGLNFSAVQPNLKSGSADQFNLIVEKQFGQNVVTAGYVGDVGHHLPLTINDVNLPPLVLSAGPGGLGLTATPTAPTKPFPTVGTIQDYVSEGSSTYHSLEFTYAHRYSKGLTAGANYTWSHEIDDVTTLSDEGQEGWGNADPFAIHQLETSNGDLDLRQRFVVYGTYDVPFGKNFSGMKKTLLGGWTTNLLLAWNSGSPYTITDNFTGQSQNVYPGTFGASGPDRPLQIAPAGISNPSVSEWFNRNAFVIPPAGVIGNAPRNGLFGPDFRHVDFSFFKNFQLTERFNLQFRSEFFNITNTPNYFIANNQNDDSTTNLVPVAGTAPNTAFGQIVRTNPNYTPRTIQLALKLLF
jgi:hypothetical protein